MSNPESSENQTKQTNKGRYQKPVPRFMSLTWLRLHMKFFIYAIVILFILSLFFIGYGTHLQSREQDKQKAEYESRVKKEVEDIFALPEELKGKANETVLSGSYANASFSVDVKSLSRQLTVLKQNIIRDNSMSESQKRYFLTYGLFSLKNNVIESVIGKNLAACYAKANNLVTEESLENEVKTELAKLHQNGYSVASTIKSFGFDNENEYKEFYKFELAAKAGFDNFLNKDRIGAASATEDYFKAYYEKNKNLFKKDDLISFEHLLVSPSDLIDSISVDDSQLATYYDNHKATLLSSKQADVLHIFINTSKATCDEAKVLELYNSEKATRFTEQPEQVKASHILIKPRGEGDENQKLEEAKKVIDELYQKAKDGEDFAKLASENSDDAGSAVNGGSLGFFGRGQMVEEFEKAAFGAEIGAITEPVKTKFGYHIIKVEDKKEEIVKPFESVKEELKEELKLKEISASATAILNEVRDKYLASNIGAEGVFVEAVKQYSNGESAVNQGKLPLFFKGEITEDYSASDSKILKDEICDGEGRINPSIENAVFALESGKLPSITEVIETPKGYHLFLVKSFAEPRQLCFGESMKNRIKSIIIKEKAENEEAEKIAKKLVTENATASIEEIVKAYGKEKEENNHVYSDVPFSNNEGKDLSGLGGFGVYSYNGSNYIPEFYKAFQTAIKEKKFNTYLEPFKTRLGWNVVRITDYKENQYETFENCREVIRHIVTQEPSDAEINEFFDKNKSRYDIEATKTIRQIICDEDIANMVYTELKNGAAFTMLARKYSTDASGANGGLMAPARKGRYTPELDEEIWKLKKGEFTKPIKTPYGYVIAMLDSETPEVKATLDKYIIDIKKNLSANYVAESKNYFAESLLNEANIVRNDDLINLIH